MNESQKNPSRNEKETKLSQEINKIFRGSENRVEEKRVVKKGLRGERMMEILKMEMKKKDSEKSKSKSKNKNRR